MNRKLIIIILVLIVLTLGAYAFWQTYNPDTINDNGRGDSVLDQDNDVEPERNITVDEPVTNSTVGKDFVVTGKARVFENQFMVRVLWNGKNIYEKPEMSDAKDTGQFGSYVHSISLAPSLVNNQRTNILLEVFEYSARDGSEINKVIVPLVYDPAL